MYFNSTEAGASSGTGIDDIRAYFYPNKNLSDMAQFAELNLTNYNFSMLVF